mmetsp:Transcript_6472/g.15995  ORF Transcript_6472/g.15995 Transcript_6472/m.15995 type:complete len:205 (-) Transcript_6472:120-734(-)
MASTSAPGPSRPSASPRPITLCSWKEELAALGAWTDEALDAATRWQPVSRRRIRGKGWHIDIGPGCPTTGMRRTAGHALQGMVLIVLLSDWEAGGGGTVLWPGSQHLVRAKLAGHESEGGISHDDLNKWCADYMLGLVRREALKLSASMNSDDEHTLVQVTGNAGDIVLVHPWLIHAGTTNLRSRVRLMANGMVRVKDVGRVAY